MAQATVRLICFSTQCIAHLCISRGL